ERKTRGAARLVEDSEDHGCAYFGEQARNLRVWGCEANEQGCVCAQKHPCDAVRQLCRFGQDRSEQKRGATRLGRRSTVSGDREERYVIQPPHGAVRHLSCDGKQGVDGAVSSPRIASTRNLLPVSKLGFQCGWNGL